MIFWFILIKLAKKNSLKLKIIKKHVLLEADIGEESKPFSRLPSNLLSRKKSEQKDFPSSRGYIKSLGIL